MGGTPSNPRLYNHRQDQGPGKARQTSPGNDEIQEEEQVGDWDRDDGGSKLMDTIGILIATKGLLKAFDLFHGLFLSTGCPCIRQ